MNVELCFKTKDTEPGKIQVIRDLTVSQAKNKFKENKEKMIMAYLRYFDGWHMIIKETLKKQGDENMEKKQINRKHTGKKVTEEQEKEIKELQNKMIGQGRNVAWLEAKHEYFEAKEKITKITLDDLQEANKEIKKNQSKAFTEETEVPEPAAKKRCLKIEETKIGLTVVLSKEDCKKIGLSMDQATKEAIVVIREKLELPPKQIRN